MRTDLVPLKKETWREFERLSREGQRRVEIEKLKTSSIRQQIEQRLEAIRNMPVWGGEELSGKIIDGSDPLKGMLLPSYINFSGVSFEGSAINGLSQDFGGFAYCILDECNFSGCRFSNTSITLNSMKNAKFTKSRLSDVRISASNIDGCDFSYAEFDNAKMEIEGSINMQGAKTKGLRLSMIASSEKQLDDVQGIVRVKTIQTKSKYKVKSLYLFPEGEHDSVIKVFSLYSE